MDDAIVRSRKRRHPDDHDKRTVVQPNSPEANANRSQPSGNAGSNVVTVAKVAEEASSTAHVRRSSSSRHSCSRCCHCCCCGSLRCRRRGRRRRRTPTGRRRRPRGCVVSAAWPSLPSTKTQPPHGHRSQCSRCPFRQVRRRIVVGRAARGAPPHVQAGTPWSTRRSVGCSREYSTTMSGHQKGAGVVVDAVVVVIAGSLLSPMQTTWCGFAAGSMFVV